MGILANFADLLGTPEAALRLLVSILLGYPVALIYRFYLRELSPTAKHLFFTVTGLLIGCYNFGFNIIHSPICVLAQYVFLRVFGATTVQVGISFVFNMVYLLFGYYYTGTDGYDIKWTMPHCVLTLRLIALSMDVYDGKKKTEKLSSDQKGTALPQTPSLLEICGQTYFLGGFLVGPQFSMRRYLSFVHGEFEQEFTSYTACVRPGLIRAALGFFYIVVYQVSSAAISNEYVTSPAFDEKPFLARVFLLGLWAKFLLYKYISCWLLTEGVCIVSGLTYNGKNEKGQNKWDGCANVKLRIYENATCFGHLIQSFNINTNNWVAHYVYKRLKFLGNRSISQGATLLFLAVWHGLHFGYYVCFFMEFIVMYFEKDVETIAARNEKIKPLFTNPALAPVRWVVGKIYLIGFIGYCLAPFVFFSEFWKVYHSVYYIGFVFFIGWMLASPVVVPALIRKPVNRPAPSADVKQE